MGHAVLGIVHPHRDRDDPEVLPGGENEEREFRLVPGGEELQGREVLQRVYAEARLRIGEFPSGLDGEPEVRELVRKGVAGRHSLRREVAAAGDERPLPRRGDERRDVGGIVLAVRVQRHREAVTLLPRGLQAGLERPAFAPVGFVPQDPDVQARQFLCRVVRAAVVHDEHR